MKLIIVLMIVFSFPSWATVTAGAQDCPTHFEGKVKEIIEPLGSEDFFAANKVVFENHQTIKGSAGDKVLVDILQNGPFKVEADKDYRVQLRDGNLCWIEEI